MAITNVQELLADMGIGFNFGNGFDCHTDDINRSDLYALARRTPKVWGNHEPFPYFFTAVKNKGFNAIRFPITWRNHIDPATWIVDIEYLDYINTFIDHIVNTLGMYCIINTMYDELPVANEYGVGWFNVTTISDPAVGDKFTSLWTQIATYFAGYNEKLIFQGYNEARDAADNWDWAPEASYAGLNLLASKFVSAVRATAGNENRYLSCGVYAAKYFRIGNLTLPDARCFADVHLYLSDVMSFKTAVDHILASGKPVIVGEFGPNSASYNDKAKMSVVGFFVTYCKSKGIAPFLWDDGGGMSIFNRNGATPANYMLPEMFAGYLIDTPDMIIASSKPKTVELLSSNRAFTIGVGESIMLSPNNLDNYGMTYFSSNPAVASFSGFSIGKLTGKSVGTTTISTYGRYGITSTQTITVVSTAVQQPMNSKISLQNISNWDVELSRTISVRPNSTHAIKCPVGYRITLTESMSDNTVIKSTVITEPIVIKMSNITFYLKITIKKIIDSTYFNLRKDFGSNYIDMTILFDKFAGEPPVDILETGGYVQKLITRNQKVIIESISSAVIPCTNINSSSNNFSILNSATTLNIFEEIVLTPLNTTDIIEYSSSDSFIASISPDGRITSFKNGTVTITITCGAITKQVTLLVDYNIYCTNLTLNNTSFVFENLTPITLIATATPANTSETIVWTSDDDAAFSVNNGVVTPHINGDGSAIITASCGLKTATCTFSMKTLFSDDFGRSVGSSTTLGTSDSGKAWLATGGTWAVTATRAGCGYAGSVGHSSYVLDLGVPNVEIMFNVDYYQYSDFWFRGNSSSNSYHVKLTSAGLVLLKLVGNVETQLASYTFTPISGTRYAFKIVANGSDISVYLNSTLRLNAIDSTYHAISSFGWYCKTVVNNGFLDNVLINRIS